MSLLSFALTLTRSDAAIAPKQLLSIEPIDDFSVPYGTVFADVALPETVIGNFSDGTIEDIGLTWDEDGYDETEPGGYELTAVMTLPPNSANNALIVPTVTVTVEESENSVQLATGTLDYISLGTTSDVQFTHTANMSFSLWFKASDNNPSGTQFILNNFTSPVRGVAIDVLSTGVVRFERINDSTGGANVFRITTVGDYCDGQWHHVSIFSPSTVANTKIYIDNVEDNTIITNTLSATTASTAAWLIGKNGNNTTQNFNGLVDNIAIWNSDQSANRTAIYNGGNLHDLALLAAPPLHYWRFDNESLLDTGTSASKLNGTFQASAHFSTDVPSGGLESFMYRIQEGDKDDISEEAGYFVWGGNVIEHAGTYYMLGNKWIDTDGFSGWVHDNRIYIGSSANKLGPFALNTEISVLRSQAWAADMVTNPNIIKIGATYYLYYVGTHYTTRSYPVSTSEARSNQKIGVASASSPAGPWTPSTNNPILSPSASDWDQNVVNNPSVYVDGNGDINMVYKSDLNGVLGDTRIGKVKLTTFEGPVTDRSTAAPNFGINVISEDPIIWKEGSQYRALFKAMDSSVVPVGNGIYAVSDDDGATFREALAPHGYNLTVEWDDATSNNYTAIERPFVLVEAGVATALFTAVRKNSNESFNLGRDLIPET